MVTWKIGVRWIRLGIDCSKIQRRLVLHFEWRELVVTSAVSSAKFC